MMFIDCFEHSILFFSRTVRNKFGKRFIGIALMMRADNRCE